MFLSQFHSFSKLIIERWKVEFGCRLVFFFFFCLIIIINYCICSPLFFRFVLYRWIQHIVVVVVFGQSLHRSRYKRKRENNTCEVRRKIEKESCSAKSKVVVCGISSSEMVFLSPSCRGHCFSLKRKAFRGVIA